MIKVLFGPDNFRIEKEIEKIIAASKAEVEVFEEGSVNELVMQLISKSFFSTKRLFVVKHLLEKLKDSDTELISALENLDKDTDVIFVESKKAATKIWKWLDKNAEQKEFQEIKGHAVVDFIKEKVAEEGGEIAPLAAERLASFAGSDLSQLTEEIKKLVLYKHSDGPEKEQIQTADVDELVASDFNANIFNLMDALAAKNNRRSAELLKSFLASGENEIYLLTMIQRQFRNIAMAKFSKGINDTTLAKKAVIHPFVAKKSIQQARNFSEEEIIKIYKKINWADLKLKSGYDPGQILLRILA